MTVYQPICRPSIDRILVDISIDSRPACRLIRSVEMLDDTQVEISTLDRVSVDMSTDMSADSVSRYSAEGVL